MDAMDTGGGGPGRSELDRLRPDAVRWLAMNEKHSDRAAGGLWHWLLATPARPDGMNVLPACLKGRVRRGGLPRYAFRGRAEAVEAAVEAVALALAVGDLDGCG